MDIYCPTCGEPWDIDSLHEVDDKTYEQARKGFYRDGCEVFGTSHGEGSADPVIQAAMDLMGSDVDGLATTLDDYFGGYYG